MSDFIEKLNELMAEREECIGIVKQYSDRKLEIELQLSVIGEQLAKITAGNGSSRRSEAMKRAWARRKAEAEQSENPFAATNESFT